ncbi:hypothetical protein HK102_002700, partial [Quaeritorhiza haematococci]
MAATDPSFTLDLSSEHAAHLKSAIQLKLTELNIPSDTILAEFITVMIANGKTKSQINDELKEIIGAEDYPTSFTDWLFPYVQSLLGVNDPTHEEAVNSHQYDSSTVNGQQSQGGGEEGGGLEVTLEAEEEEMNYDEGSSYVNDEPQERERPQQSRRRVPDASKNRLLSLAVNQATSSPPSGSLSNTAATSSTSASTASKRRRVDMEPPSSPSADQPDHSETVEDGHASDSKGYEDAEADKRPKKFKKIEWDESDTIHKPGSAPSKGSSSSKFGPRQQQRQNREQASTSASTNGIRIASAGADGKPPLKGPSFMVTARGGETAGTRRRGIGSAGDEKKGPTEPNGRQQRQQGQQLQQQPRHSQRPQQQQRPFATPSANGNNINMRLGLPVDFDEEAIQQQRQEELELLQEQENQEAAEEAWLESGNAVRCRFWPACNKGES